MSIFTKFLHKIIATGSDDAGEEISINEPKGSDPTPEEEAIRKQEILRKEIPLSEILKNEDVKEIIKDLYNVYTSDEFTFKDFLYDLKTTIDEINRLFGSDNLPDNFNQKFSNLIVTCFSKSLSSKDIISDFNAYLTTNFNSLLTLLELLDTFVIEFQKDPEAMSIFCKEVVNTDIDSFMKTILPLIQYFRMFKVTPYTEITTQQKQDVIDLANDFTKKYSNSIDAINMQLKAYKKTLKNRGAGHTSVIGGNGGL